MLSMIGDLLNAIKDGRWSMLPYCKALLRQGSDQPDALPGVSDSANSAADWVKEKRASTLAASACFQRDGNTRVIATTTLAIYARLAVGFPYLRERPSWLTAMKNQLMRYFTGKTTGRRLKTIMDIVSTWAPAGDNNDPQQYARQVAVGWECRRRRA
ncbi:hypothetical protein [Raoultella ornithinolytica]|uniref:hypothetical protein n=1 Tax=Raoultella ornithinolytica TaxID=54291 RepID=UPI00396A20E3